MSPRIFAPATGRVNGNSRPEVDRSDKLSYYSSDKQGLPDMIRRVQDGTTTFHSGMSNSEVLAAIHTRLCKAFPEVARLFPVLTAAVDDGEPWRTAFDDYVDRLGDRHLHSLCSEVADLFGMGWDERQFEIVVCAIFGLDPAYVQAGSAWNFVATLEERLSGQRLARHARSG